MQNKNDKYFLKYFVRHQNKVKKNPLKVNITWIKFQRKMNSFLKSASNNN